MKRVVIIGLLTIIGICPILGQPRHIQPNGIAQLPTASYAEYIRLAERDAQSKSLTARERKIVEDYTVYDDLYAGYCSWYCGGEVLKVTATSCLHPIGKFSYDASHAHDFDHESVWAEGAKGQGIGESLTYEFAGGCPRITTVNILNGHVKSEKAWRENSRVKELLVYYNGMPYAILDLQNSRTLQSFDVGVLGFHDPAAKNWTLKFEILSVYPGTKYEDTVISELYFDGIDVH
ncbi:MAG: hypothetical protein IKT00_09510 [Prevotella sp.]|nr:hypothetical protein [Prevotella sp.]